ncbi:MAG: PQQ-binding-like beta-propeller repeat protein [Acidobacteriota bacterium]
MIRPLLLATASALVLASSISVHATDWHQYRGPDRDGRSTETNLSFEWPKDGPTVAWRVPLGSGFSALTAVDGTIYTLYGKDERTWLGAFAADTGKQRWQVDIDKEFTDQYNFGDGPRSTPLVHAGVVYTASSRGTLTARKSADGSEIWSRDLATDFAIELPTFGLSASPLLIDGRLILEIGGNEGRGTVAFDIASGKEIWTADTGKAGYSSPVEVTIDDQRQVVIFAGKQVVGLEPASGTILWTHPWETGYDVNAATPIFVAPDQLYVASGNDVGGGLLEIARRDGAWVVEEVWKSRKLQNHYHSSVLADGTIYGYHNELLTAADVATGKVSWKQRGFGHGTVVWADGHLILLGVEGDLAIAKADPERYDEVARAKPLEGKHWTVPTLHRGHLLIRNESELVAFDLRRDAATP